MSALRHGQTTIFFHELQREGEKIEGEFKDLFMEYYGKKLKFLIYSDKRYIPVLARIVVISYVSIC